MSTVDAFIVAYFALLLGTAIGLKLGERTQRQP
jgi:hypothetical protein